ncbi:hypothetical protein [Rhodococcus sp. BS-15]|uniref:hypothetical protein n=1 Tax=Rhodococcus sp. BS-15 TaxID=1304954 RepID=UPI001651883A|nr:hypothetical protein [Rhodococcus sp. BS-15]
MTLPGGYCCAAGAAAATIVGARVDAAMDSGVTIDDAIGDEEAIDIIGDPCMLGICGDGPASCAADNIGRATGAGDAGAAEAGVDETGAFDCVTAATLCAERSSLSANASDVFSPTAAVPSILSKSAFVRPSSVSRADFTRGSVALLTALSAASRTSWI